MLLLASAAVYRRYGGEDCDWDDSGKSGEVHSLSLAVGYLLSGGGKEKYVHRVQAGSDLRQGGEADRLTVLPA